MNHCCNITSNPLTGVLWRASDEPVITYRDMYRVDSPIDPAVFGSNIFMDDVLILTNLDIFEASVWVPTLRILTHEDTGGFGAGSGYAFGFWISVEKDATPPLFTIGFNPLDPFSVTNINLEYLFTYTDDETYCASGLITTVDDDWFRYLDNVSITYNAEIVPSIFTTTDLATIKTAFDTWAKTLWTNDVTTDVIDNGDDTWQWSIYNMPYLNGSPTAILTVAHPPDYLSSDVFNIEEIPCP